MVQPNPHNIYSVNVPPRPGAKQKPDETYEEYDGRAGAYFRRLKAWEEYCSLRGWKTESEYIFPDGSLYCTVQAPLEELQRLKAVTSIYEDWILSEDEIERSGWRGRRFVERAFRLYLRGFDLPMFNFVDDGIEPKLIALADKLALPFKADDSKWLFYSLSRDGNTIKYKRDRVVFDEDRMTAVFLSRAGGIIRCFFENDTHLDVNADLSEEDINRIQQMLSLEAVEGT